MSSLEVTPARGDAAAPPKKRAEALENELARILEGGGTALAVDGGLGAGSILRVLQQARQFAVDVANESRATPSAESDGRTGASNRGAEAGVREGTRGDRSKPVKLADLPKKGAFSRQRIPQIETPEFKRWFGDWERARDAKVLSQAEPVKISVLEVSERTGSSIDMAAMRDEARAYAGKNLIGRYRNARSGLDFEVRRGGVEQAIQHQSGPDKLRAFAAVPDVLRDGVVVYGGKNPKNERSRLVVVASRVEIGGRAFMVSAGIHEDANGRSVYDHEVLDMKKVEARLSSQSGAAASPGSAPSSGSTQPKDYTLELLSQAERASKVVDSDGRPLMVYHVTGADFDAFRDDRPVFVAFRERDARMAALGSGKTLELYARAVNPANTRETPVHFLDVSKTFRENPDTDAIYVSDKAGVSLALRSSSQLKLATSNNGKFDPADPRMVLVAPTAPSMRR